ncbi:MAG: hypothetical protein JWM56_823 [Candidatus Peribacteria bacterium]|nr:hypothetical protein [Candidatus Peribacteria bacterium]
MTIALATNQAEWDNFLVARQFSPFLQSWTMGEVYAELHQTPVRWIIKDGDEVRGICMGLIVPARRGRHLSVPYGPVITDPSVLPELLEAIKQTAHEHRCSFIRLSPHWPVALEPTLQGVGAKPAPLHLLAEHLWYIPLKETDPWTTGDKNIHSAMRSEEDLLKHMRSTARNLIRRAEKDGVTVTASSDPVGDLQYFLTLHDETRQRHKFTPYSNAFFRAQVAHFAPRKECTLYLAHYRNEVISASIHMHAGGETSYHHGASTFAHRKVPSSYLLQWTAIRDALKRGDGIYNFWGIAPMNDTGEITQKNHPFSGVTLFKTGFGGKLLTLVHCMDIPLSPKYYVTRTIEKVRKWKRGF